MKSLHILDDRLWFPPVNDADEEGLLAIGGDLSTERLILAYRKGIFPWFEGEVPLWWCPNPRFVLFPKDLRISKSMHQVLQRQQFTITRNQDFAAVIEACRKTPRPGQNGTWITDRIMQSYIQLHQMGLAVSYEAWQYNEIVGGFYGIKMGRVFFGESMFSSVSNASKAAFITAVDQMHSEGVAIIDCQVYTEHLESLGAMFIDRALFTDMLRKYIPDYQGTD